jgi:hypothetical protein
MTKHYYAAHSDMGLNYTYDSPCWAVFVFENKAERDRWVKGKEYRQDTGNYVAMPVTLKVAKKIRKPERWIYLILCTEEESQHWTL